MYYSLNHNLIVEAHVFTGSSTSLSCMRQWKDTGKYRERAIHTCDILEGVGTVFYMTEEGNFFEYIDHADFIKVFRKVVL